MTEAKAKQYEDIYLRYVEGHKTAKQIADELQISPRTVFYALKKIAQKSMGLNNEQKIRLNLDKILHRIQKLQNKIDTANMTPAQEIAFYREMRECEKYASELEGLLKYNTVEIKDSNVLLAHNVPGIQKAIEAGKRKGD